jgi:hypothetical protein
MVMMSPDMIKGFLRNGHRCKARERRGAGRYMSPSAVEPIAEMPDDPAKSGCDM